MLRRVSIFAIALALAGCHFDTTGVSFQGDGAVLADAATNRPDGSTERPDAAAPYRPDAGPTIIDARPADANDCGWSYQPAHFDPCAIPVLPLPVNLTMAGTSTYDTDTGLLTGDLGISAPLSSVTDGVRIIWSSTFNLASDTTLRVVGSLPLHVVATDDLTVAGTLDASSFLGNSGYEIGAGADPTDCPESPPDPGQTCAQHGGSGGGAGALGSDGGEGGEGGDTHTCVTDGIPGGAGGIALGAPPDTIRGGCGGRDGAPNNSSDSGFGRGAPGGGAVMLTAAHTLTVSGTVHVGGAGGGPGTDNRAGGGGGGSGGFIGLEGNDLVVAGVATLAANGGGGGGGCDNAAAQPGESGHPSGEVAAGGTHEGAGGDGGDGGYRDLLPGQPGHLATRGGGGGGGGVGFILVYPHNDVTIGAATISPPHVTM